MQRKAHINLNLSFCFNFLKHEKNGFFKVKADKSCNIGFFNGILATSILYLYCMYCMYVKFIFMHFLTKTIYESVIYKNPRPWLNT